MNIDRAILAAMTLLAAVLWHFGLSGATSDTGAGYVHIAALLGCGGVSTLVLLAVFRQI